MEKLWVRRELGEDLFRTVEENNWIWVLIRTKSNTLPDDIYCRTLIYVDSNDDKLDTHFVLKFPQVRLVEKVK
jgi:hypothetical protein